MRRQNQFSFGLLYFLFVAFILFLPIILLVIFSFNDSTKLVFPLRGFTLAHYQELGSNREMLEAVETSVLLGLGSSLLATILGTMGAIALARFKFPGRGLFTAVSALPLVIPYVILGVSLLIMFNQIGLKLSAWTAGLAHVVISIPYALLIISARMAGFPENLEEAAMDLGASYWGALLRVTIPISFPALVAAFLICFTISFDEFAISSFLVGTQPTLPVYLYSQLRFPTRLPLVVALSAILMVTTMAVMLLAEWLRRLGQTSD
ncbi:MAG: ABC transporter permease [Ardenticatenaceae bacterium]|nr:ABC transporter permease [Ardenticatenaceae bacterium]MCB9444087.1 ABC transporter permease [Ardenticatenaceae bacterium]